MKLRGGKRNNRKLYEHSNNFSMGLEDDHWYNFWHDHFDFEGWSNKKGWKNKYVRSYFVALNNLKKQLKNYNRPYQVLIEICMNDQTESCIMFHTENPQKNFPMVFDNPKPVVLKHKDLPELIKNNVDKNNYFFAYVELEGMDYYYIIPKFGGFCENKKIVCSNS